MLLGREYKNDGGDMEYKFFNEIICQNDNAEVIANVILEKICKGKLEDLCFWFTSRIHDWEKCVFIEDIKHFRDGETDKMIIHTNDYNGELLIKSRRIFMTSSRDTDSEDNMPKDPEELANEDDVLNSAKSIINQEKLDISAKLKLLEYILICKALSDSEGASLKRIMQRIRPLRNKYKGHLTDERRSETKDDKVINTVSKLIGYVQQASDSYGDYEGIREILIGLKDELNGFLETFRIARGVKEEDLSQLDEIDVEKLFAYNVFIDGSVFESDYHNPIYQLINIKKQGHDRNTFIEKGIFDGIVEKRRDKTRDSRTVFDTICDHCEQGYITIIGSDIEYAWRAEPIIKHIKERLLIVPNVKICVLTEDLALAKELQELNNKNVIAVHPKGSRHFSVIRSDKDKKNETGIKYESEVQSEKSERNLIMVRVDHDLIDKEDSTRNEFDIRAGDNTNVEAMEDELYYEMPVEGGRVYVGGLSRLHEETLYERIGGGGEGSIYDYGAGNSIIKIFDKKGISNEKEDKILQMVKYYSENQSDGLFELVCWPQMRVLDRHKKKAVGYAMKHIRQSKGGVTTLQGLINLFSEKPDNYQRMQLVNCCMKMVVIFEKLHDKNILVGDVNPNNILVTMRNDRVEDVFFIDVDSYQFMNYNCNVGTKEYTSPRLYRSFGRNLDYSKIKRTMEDERFSIAVLLFFTLFLGEFPFLVDADRDIITSIVNKEFRFKVENSKETRRNYIWKNLTEEVKNLFRRAFMQEDYCTEGEWDSALVDLMIAEKGERPAVSNELYPNDAVESEDDHWRKINCVCCGKLFWIAKANPEYDDDWCKSCKEIRMLNLKRVYRMICKNCGGTWTCSKWDLIQGRDMRRIKCPDCDAGFKFSKIKRIDNDTDKSEKLILEWQSFAFKNLKESNE